MVSWNGTWTHPEVNVYKDGANGAPTEGWDHTAVIHVYKLYGDKTAEGYDLPTSTATYRTATTSKTELSLGNQSALEVSSTGVSLDVSVMDAFGVIYKPETVSYSGPTSGEITLTDGVGSFMPSVLGEYVFTVGDMTRRISVLDTTAPIIALKDSVSNTYYTDDIDVGFNDLILTDNYDLEFLQSYTIYQNGKIVNKISGLGEYTVKYFVEDSNGNSATYDRIITVVDNAAPTVTIGSHPTEYNVGDTIYLPVATALDNFDENPTITYAVTYNGNEVPVVNDAFVAESAGEYTITVYVQDTSGNVAQESSTVVVRQVAQSGGFDILGLFRGEVDIEEFFLNVWNWIVSFFSQIFNF